MEYGYARVSSTEQNLRPPGSCPAGICEAGEHRDGPAVREKLRPSWV